MTRRARALNRVLRACARAGVGAAGAMGAMVLLSSSPALAAPTCILDVSPTFGIGDMQVRVLVASSATSLSQAGSTRIYLFVDGQTAPTLIGQSRGAGSLGASADYTVHLAAGSHRIQVACQSTSGTTYANASVNLIPEGTAVAAGIFGVLLLVVVVAAASSSGTKSTPTAAPARPAPPPPPPPPPPPLRPPAGVAPVLASGTPQLLRDPSSQSHGSPQRCADALADHGLLENLMSQRRALQSEITAEWTAQAATKRALLDVYRSLCDERLNLWIATGLNSVEEWSAVTYQGASFAHGVVENLGKALHLTIPSVDKGLKIAFTSRGAMLLAGAAARKVASDKLEDSVKDAIGVDVPIDPDEATQKVLDHFARVDRELVDKLTDAFSQDLAEYGSNAAAYNASVRRWHADRQAQISALAQAIDRAHSALRQSFWDCHGRLFDDSALGGGGVDLGGEGMRMALGDLSPLEVPTELALRSER